MGKRPRKNNGLILWFRTDTSTTTPENVNVRRRRRKTEYPIDKHLAQNLEKIGQGQF